MWYVPTRLISHSLCLPSGYVFVSRDQIIAGTRATPQGVRSTSFVLRADHKSKPVAWLCGGRTRVSLTAWRDKRMRCSWPIGLSLDTMLPDVCSKHVLVCMVKVYMSCVISTPQTPVLDSSDQL